jgi:tRNA A22 N-methylase
MIIQSNNDHELLREEVCKLGFKITHEEFLIDNKKSYINIVFERGNSNYNKNQLKYGPILMHNRNYLRYQMDYLNNILSKIPNNKLLIKFRLKREIRKLRNFEKNIDK